MRSSARFLVVFLVTAVAPAAAFAQGAWQTLRGVWGDFSVQVMGKGRYSTGQTEASGGPASVIHRHVFWNFAPGRIMSFAVQYTEYPREIDVSNPRNNLQAGLNRAARGMDGGRFDRVEWRAIAGRPVFDAIGHRGQRVNRVVAVMRGRRIYTLTFAGPRGSEYGPEAERFVRSFRFRY